MENDPLWAHLTLNTISQALQYRAQPRRNRASAYWTIGLPRDANLKSYFVDSEAFYTRLPGVPYKDPRKTGRAEKLCNLTQQYILSLRAPTS